MSRSTKYILIVQLQFQHTQKSNLIFRDVPALVAGNNLEQVFKTKSKVLEETGWAPSAAPAAAHALGYTRGCSEKGLGSIPTQTILSFKWLRDFS